MMVTIMIALRLSGKKDIPRIYLSVCHSAYATPNILYTILHVAKILLYVEVETAIKIPCKSVGLIVAFCSSFIDPYVPSK